MSASLGGPAALRGFRLQTIYALWRLLMNEQHCSIRLEGAEDIDILGSDGSVTELVQVKAYSQPLTLSDFFPKGRSSFLRRVVAGVTRYPQATWRLVSIGDVGPELANAWEAQGKERDAVEAKLTKRGFQPHEIQLIFTRLEITKESAEALHSGIIARLREMSIAGGEPVNARDILCFWLQLCSESRKRISVDDLHEKLQDVGRYFAARRSHHAEWFTAIRPIELEQGVEYDHELLRRELYQGVGARYSHIAADVDVPRRQKLKDIDDEFQKTNVIIIHGASGQGKSTLAYRYLHEYVPAKLRFEVASIQDLRHAQSISAALIGYARALEVPLFIYIDVQPRDTIWLEIAARLAALPAVRLLVTIREEDWLRSQGTSATRFAYRDIPLEFDRDEAQLIYAAIAARSPSEWSLDFAEAWRTFDPVTHETAKPLLEFVFWVTQSVDLRARLAEQVQALWTELAAEEMKFLAAVSVVSAYGARIELNGLGQTLGLDRLPVTLKRLEKEYLVRTSLARRYVEGLHPIRSRVLSELITDDGADDWSWMRMAELALRNVVDSDLEIFLLHLFSEREEATGRWFESQQVESSNWAEFAIVLRSLQWLDVRDHIDANRAQIDESMEAFGTVLSAFLEWDIVGVMQRYDNGTSENLFETLARTEEQKRLIRQHRERQPVPYAAFAASKAWLQGSSITALQPVTAADWLGLAEASYWVSYWGIACLPLSEMPILEPCESLPNLSMADLSRIMYGISLIDRADMRKLWQSLHPKALSRFREETKTIHIQSDGSRSLRAHYIVDDLPNNWGDAGGGENNSTDNTRDLHAEAMYRVELLHRLEPHYEGYGCQGYGHMIPELELPYDPTTKTHVKIAALCNTQAAKWNAVFRNVCAYPRRPMHWREYAQILFHRREKCILALNNIRLAAERHFSSRRVLNGFSEFQIDEDLQRDGSAPLPGLPRSAVDAWGLTSETNAEPPIADSIQADTAQHKSRLTYALHRYEHFYNIAGKFFQSLGNFLNQSQEVLLREHMLARTTKEKQRRAVALDLKKRGFRAKMSRLSLCDLMFARRELDEMQEEFRQLFGQYFAPEQLQALELHEREACLNTWCVWFYLIHFARRRVRGVESEAVDYFERRVHLKHQRLERRLAALGQKGVKARIIRGPKRWKGDPALWIAFEPRAADGLLDEWRMVRDAVASALKPDHPIDEYLAWQCWYYVLVVPCWKGRAVCREAWALNALAVTKKEDSVLSQIRQPVEPELWASVQLATWDDLFEVEVYADICTAIGQLFVLVSNMAGIGDIPTLDDESKPVLLAHISDCRAPVEAAWSRLCVALDTFGDMFERLLEQRSEDGPGEMLEVLHELMVQAKDMKEKYFARELEFPDMADWRVDLLRMFEVSQYGQVRWLAIVTEPYDG